jgi:Fe-S-cluster-containing hydrogenase component 2
MEPISVVAENCSGCSSCCKACAFGAVSMTGSPAKGTGRPTAVVDVSRCTLCGACADACESPDAIVFARADAEGRAPENHSGIAVFAEHRRGALASVVPEMVGAARELKKSLRSPVCAILVGKGVSKLVDGLFMYGVDEVWMIDDPAVGDFQEDVQAALVAAIVEEKKPEIFLGGGTVVGRSLMPRVAARLGTGLTADCTGLSVDCATGLLVQTRPAFGGNVMASIITEKRRPQMATVRPKVMKAAD